MSTYGIRVLFFEPIHSLRNPGRKGMRENERREKQHVCVISKVLTAEPTLTGWSRGLILVPHSLLRFLSLWPSVSLLLSISSFIQRMPPAWNSRKMRGVENSWDYPFVPHPFLPEQQQISHRLFHQNSLFPITGERNDHLSLGQAATPKAERSCLALLCLFFILSPIIPFQELEQPCSFPSPRRGRVLSWKVFYPSALSQRLFTRLYLPHYKWITGRMRKDNRPYKGKEGEEWTLYVYLFEENSSILSWGKGQQKRVRESPGL